MTRGLTHERCAHRCCCDSWSCEPHLAGCEIVTGRHRVDAETGRQAARIAGELRERAREAA